MIEPRLQFISVSSVRDTKDSEPLLALETDTTAVESVWMGPGAPGGADAGGGMGRQGGDVWGDSPGRGGLGGRGGGDKGKKNQFKITCNIVCRGEEF